MKLKKVTVIVDNIVLPTKTTTTQTIPLATRRLLYIEMLSSLHYKSVCANGSSIVDFVVF